MTYDDEASDQTVKGFSVRPFPPPVYHLLQVSSQAISNYLRIFLDFGSSYDPLDLHEATVHQHVSITDHLPLFLSRYSPNSKASKVGPTSVITVATITMHGTHDRPDNNIYTGAGKEGCAAWTRSGWLLRM